MRNNIFLSILLLGAFSVADKLPAQTPDSALYGALKWRMIGPHRGGRTVGASGVPQQPNVFYIGVNNGGVWKTTDYGRTWNSVFDDQPTGSIGDVAVAPSNPNVVYAASGEGIQRPDLSVGDGMYKSTDAGKTWTHQGLRDGQQIGGLAVDPNNENRVFAAVLGHPYGPNTERGVFRTTNGGASWERVLYIDENTGAVQVAIAPKNTQIVYADMWACRQGPWENSSWQGPGSGLFKSMDGGSTWKKLAHGLPTIKQGLGRIGFAISPSMPNRLFATVDATDGGGIYRSDDGGENWTLLASDPRLWGRGSDFAEVKVDPKNPDVVYSVNVVVWKSEDGGHTWKGIKGAPGGDDSHRLWINPDKPEIMLLSGDQGGVITVNGGQTWSSWYNQPTAQFYHVIADNAFPYNVYGGQQESGSIGIASRGNDGAITFREYHPVGVEEYGYAAPDPLDPNIIYGGKLSKYDKRTGQIQNIAPEATRGGKYRFVRTAPVLFSPIDPKTLYYAGNVIFKTQTGGASWEVISPDLTRETYDVPENIGVYRTEEMKKMNRRGVVYTVAPSPVEMNTIWAGTDDGYIQLTRDGGKTWKNVTPAEISSWSKISLIEAGHSSPLVAYAAVNRIRLDDQRPHIYRTRDGGGTWQEIVSGLPNDPINAVREDPTRKGLLFAASERAVYVSFDDGDHWRSLRLNMPATSIRDIVVKDNDLIAGTHGRSFWILDDIASLRQMNTETSSQPAQLFEPAPAYRVRWNMNPDTPLPPEEPAGENPPDGAIIDYYLKEKAKGVVTLDILDAGGQLVRRFTSADRPYTIPDVNIPLYWIRPQQILSAEPSAHRFLWDLYYTPLNIPSAYPIAAVYQNTAPSPTSPFALPGVYTVQLTVNGKTYKQNLTIKMDPRVKSAPSDWQKQFDLSMICYQNRKIAMDRITEIQNVQNQLKERINTSKGDLNGHLKILDDQLTSFIQPVRGARTANFERLQNDFGSLLAILNETDMPPTQQTETAINDLRPVQLGLSVQLDQLKKVDFIKINAGLKKGNLKPLQF